MELKFSIFVETVFLVGVLFILDVILKQWRNPRRSEKLPPGPWKLPFIGNLHQVIAGGSLPWRTFRDLARKHGPIMHLRVGQVSTVVVSSPRLAKEVLHTHALSFLDRPELFGSEVLFYKKSDLIFSPHGAFWKQMRKFCALELLSKTKVRSYGTIRESEVSDLIASLSAGSSPINLTKKLFKLSSAITSRTIFGCNFDGQEELIPLIDNISGFFGDLNIAEIFPSLGFLNMITGTNNKLQRTHHKFDFVFNRLLNDYRTKWLEKRGSTKTKPADENLLDALIRLQQGGGFEVEIADATIKGVILDLFLGGTDTSSTIVDWALSELMKNPKMMQKAQAEVRHIASVGGNKTTINEIDIPKLNYLTMIVKETLRLHPPAPLLVPRQCREACQIDGYTIPIKTRVVVNAWAIGRDPSFWDDAETFKPERFENNAIDFRGNDFELLPFSAGRRMCPGLSFGISVTEITLAKLLYHFDWDLPQGTTPMDFSMEESFGMVCKRKNELYLQALPWNGLSNFAKNV